MAMCSPNIQIYWLLNIHRLYSWVRDFEMEDAQIDALDYWLSALSQYICFVCTNAFDSIKHAHVDKGRLQSFNLIKAQRDACDLDQFCLTLHHSS